MAQRGLVVLLPFRVRPVVPGTPDLTITAPEIPTPPALGAEITVPAVNVPPVSQAAATIPQADLPMLYPITGLIGDARPGTPSGVHTGVDYAMPEGQAVAALKHGRIKYAGWFDQYSGNAVLIEYDDGVIAGFHHLSSVGATAAGQEVWPNTTIGFIGHTGSATGPHLHLELHRGSGNIGSLNQIVDPRSYYLA